MIYVVMLIEEEYHLNLGDGAIVYEENKGFII